MNGTYQIGCSMSFSHFLVLHLISLNLFLQYIVQGLRRSGFYHLGPRNCGITPGRWLMKTGYRTYSHTLDDRIWILTTTPSVSSVWTSFCLYLMEFPSLLGDFSDLFPLDIFVSIGQISLITTTMRRSFSKIIPNQNKFLISLSFLFTFFLLHLQMTSLYSLTRMRKWFIGLPLTFSAGLFLLFLFFHHSHVIRSAKYFSLGFFACKTLKQWFTHFMIFTKHSFPWSSRVFSACFIQQQFFQKWNNKILISSLFAIFASVHFMLSFKRPFSVPNCKWTNITIQIYNRLPSWTILFILVFFLLRDP